MLHVILSVLLSEKEQSCLGIMVGKAGKGREQARGELEELSECGAADVLYNLGAKDLSKVHPRSRGGTKDPSILAGRSQVPKGRDMEGSMVSGPKSTPGGSGSLPSPVSMI